MSINEVSSHASKLQAPAQDSRVLATRVSGPNPSALSPPPPEPARDESVEQSRDESVEQSVERLNQTLQTIRRELSFTVDQDTGDTVIKVIDSETKQLIRKIPAQETITLLERLGQAGAGLMVDVTT